MTTNLHLPWHVESDMLFDDNEMHIFTSGNEQNIADGIDSEKDVEARLDYAAKACNMHDELLAACEAQYEAMDWLFSQLISQSPDNAIFYPSKSGQPWEAMLFANAVITKAKKG